MKLRRILAAVMACSIVCGAPAAMRAYQPSYELTANAADIVDSGKLGDNISWQYDSEGTLTISGKGNMPPLSDVEYSDGSAILSPWNYQTQMCKEAKKLVVKEGITSISHGAFNPMHNLESIDLPNGLNTIENGAFGWTGFPKTIEIPESVVRIDERAFFQAHLLSITINNPNCEIYDDIRTFADQDYETWEYSLPTIYGYKGSTAEAYAEKYGYGFKEIGSETTTTTTTTTTKQTTTKQTITTTSTTTTTTTATETETTSAATTTESAATTASTTAPSRPEVSFGEPTGDGKIDAKDSSFVLVEYAKLSTGGESTLSDAEKSAADVNKDGKADAKDASAILTYYAYVSTGGDKSISEFLTNE